MSTTEELNQAGPKMPTGISRTLVVGVGGTGKEVMTRIRKHLIQGFDSLERVPVISFVQIDTDPAQAKVHIEKEYADASKLKGNEMVRANLAASDLGGDISKHRHLASWLSPGIEKYEITDGAKQIRQLGRLAFFARYNDIFRALQSGYERSINPDHADRMIDDGLLTESDGFNIYVIGSVSGGTGGGMIQDVAFQCRRIVKNVKGAKVFGYVVLPEVFSEGGDTRVRANAFAALKEIDYFSCGHALKGQYTPEAVTQFELKNRPFSTCYLVNGTNEEGVKLNATQLYDMLALHIFTDFVPGGIGSLNRSNRDNLSARLDYPDKLGCNQAYMALGVSRIFFPYDRLIKACGLKMSVSLMDQWLRAFAAGHEYARMKECVDDYCRQNPLWQAGDLHAGIVGKLTTNPDNGLMREVIHAWLDGLYETVKTQKTKNVRDLFSKAFGDFEEEMYFDADPFEAKWRGFPKQIHKNVAMRLPEFQKSIDAEICKRVDLDLSRNEAGLSYTIQFLNQLEDRLKGYETRYKKAQEQELEYAEEYFAKVSKALDELHAASSDLLVGLTGGRKTAVDLALDKLRDAAIPYFEAQLLTKAYKLAPALLSLLQNHLQDWRTLLSETQGTLTMVRNELQETETKIRIGTEPGEIYDEADIEEFFDLIVPDGEIRRSRLEELHQRVNRAFDCDGFHQLPLRTKSEMDFKQRMLDVITTIASEFFRDIAKTSLAERFYKKYPNQAAQEMVLKEAFKRSAPYLSLEAVPGYAHDLPENLSFAIGIAGGNQKPPDPYFAQLLKQLKIASPKVSDRYIMDMTEREKHQVLFIRERAAFPLRAISQMKEYNLIYQDYQSKKPTAGGLSKEQNPPLHLVKDDALFNVVPGVLPADETRLAQAMRAFAVGTCWGIFELEGDTVVYRVPRQVLGVADAKVIGSIHEPDKAIIRLVDLEAEGPGQKVLEQVLEKIQRKVAEARVNAAVGAELHRKLQDEFVRREKLAQEAYRRENPEVDAVNEGYKHTLDFRFCNVIYEFLLETGLRPQEGATAHEVTATVSAAPAPAPASVQGPSPVAAGSATCAACQQENPVAARFCAFCMEAMPEVRRVARSVPIPAPRHCGSCQGELLGGARGCHMCGWKVPPAGVRCGACAEVAPAEAKFCPACVEPIVLA